MIVCVKIRVIEYILLHTPGSNSGQPVSQSNEIINDPIDVEVEKNAFVVAIHEIAAWFIGHIVNVEVNKVVSFRIRNPSYNSAGRCPRQTKHIIYLIEEEMPTNFEDIIRVALNRFQKVKVKFWILLPSMILKSARLPT